MVESTAIYFSLVPWDCLNDKRLCTYSYEEEDLVHPKASKEGPVEEGQGYRRRDGVLEVSAKYIRIQFIWTGSR